VAVYNSVARFIFVVMVVLFCLFRCCCLFDVVFCLLRRVCGWVCIGVGCLFCLFV